MTTLRSSASDFNLAIADEESERAAPTLHARVPVLEDEVVVVRKLVVEVRWIHEAATHAHQHDDGE
jgi:hypothetical protein